MLEQRSLDLHSPRSADTGMRYVSIAADLVGRVDDDDALTQLIRKQPGALAQHGRLADAGAPKEQDALAADDDVTNDLPRTGDGATDSHRETRDTARAIADRGNTMQGALDAGAVVVAELTDVVGDVFEV